MIFNLTATINRSINASVNGGLFCFLAFAILSCGKSGNKVLPAKDSTVTVITKPVFFPKTTYDPAALDSTKLFNRIPVTNNLARKGLFEISGIAASKVNPGILYIHNDSGNSNQVYLTDASGGR